jgi:DNA polymerase-3 subunit beta
MANNPEHEEAEEVIAVSYAGERIEIGLNVNYLLDLLNTLPKGNVVFTFSGSEKSVLIEHENDSLDALNVVMPMRL